MEEILIVNEHSLPVKDYFKRDSAYRGVHAGKLYRGFEKLGVHAGRLSLRLYDRRYAFSHRASGASEAPPADFKRLCGAFGLRDRSAEEPHFLPKPGAPAR